MTSYVANNWLHYPSLVCKSVCTAVNMKGFLAFVVCLVATNGYIPNYGEYETEWLAWKSFHNKKYETQREEDARHDIWWDNLKVSFKFYLLDKENKLTA